MSIKLLVDMNLSPDWVEVFKRNGWNAIHWFNVGDPKATDRTIMAWANANKYVVFTHDLDFGTLLAVTHATGPSVIQIRTQNVSPEYLESIVIAALKQCESQLETGVLIVVNESSRRIRILPLNP